MDAAPVGDGPPLAERIADRRTEAADSALAEAQLASRVRNQAHAFAAGLPEREAAVFSARMLAEEPPSLETLAGHHRVSRERIRQIERDLLRGFKSYAAPALGL
jgi:DNA-directed RNA polymerase sigma subunit (sigma70/sigma32)